MNKDLLPKDKKPLYRGSSPWETDGPLGREMQADSMKGGRAIKVWAALREASREGKPSELGKAGAPLIPGPGGARGSRGVELWTAALHKPCPVGRRLGVHAPTCVSLSTLPDAQTQWESGGQGAKLVPFAKLASVMPRRVEMLRAALGGEGGGMGQGGHLPLPHRAAADP